MASLFISNMQLNTLLIGDRPGQEGELYLTQLVFDAINVNNAIISKRRNIVFPRQHFAVSPSIQGVFTPIMALDRSGRFR